MWLTRRAQLSGFILLGMSALAANASHAAEAGARRVEFPSADGRTKLVGYVFVPATKGGISTPAVVMMHGRAGAYSTLAKGRYDASTLSQRHQFWGRFWAQQGYIAILVDGFGPRGHPQGFGRFSYKTRPAALDEVTVRPLDAYGALAYLRARGDVLGDRVGLQGWSNGGSATLAAMAPDAPGLVAHNASAGFRAALSFYPGCRLKRRFDATGYGTYAPLRVFMGTADDEVSPRVCRNLLARARGDVEVRFYNGATHDFDDPGRRRQSVKANAVARDDVIVRAPAFFAERLRAQRAN